MTDGDAPHAEGREIASSTTHSATETEFEALARKEVRGMGSWAFVQLFLYVRDSKRWWLLPVIIALLLTGILIVLGGTAAAPFIYTLF